MDTQSPKHLITEMGVLKSFSLAKKISADVVREYKNRIKKITKTKAQGEELLKQAVLREAQKEIDPSQVPGIIVEKKSGKRQETEKKLMGLTYFCSVISKKITEKKISKFEKCYIINVLINMMGLIEEDFDNFHNNFNKFKAGEIESPEDGDDNPFEIG
jgi:hypothetical protein